MSSHQETVPAAIENSGVLVEGSKEPGGADSTVYTQGSRDTGADREEHLSSITYAMDKEDLAKCEVCKEDFDCDSICQECLVMKCTGCTSYQMCGTCNTPICRQCTRIHGKKCCADRSANAHLHFPNLMHQAGGCEPPGPEERMIVTINQSEASNKSYEDPERRKRAEDKNEEKEEETKG